ncbi:endonuclease domain-containing protein [Bifidobacterium stellenboschense]|uniref:Endonuclease n=1 Tax=Bifidobacterium stellenboschense TaxID=762211 RepID=A0A087E0X5_9BIFI|nr:endonuclease domain-containing protein [Bifidobacterium stellenboschense]KFJ01426.1 endonuclease [Bifidobacterium stellenboschense]
MKHYVKSNIANARGMRSHMTPWELKLWNGFLRRQSVRFRRQAPLLGFIADFYCAKAKLIIEIDGGGHFDAVQHRYDENRTRVFEQAGIEVLRFTNLDVDTNFDGVCERIESRLLERMEQVWDKR